MDVVYLSRLQFAMAAMFHFLFVPLTLGLGFMVAIMESWFVRSGDELYRRMARFWGRLFVINFGLGVVTGLTLEFQFGTNWKHYSLYVGDVFGSLLAIEATVAFFAESTFLGLWIFGWKRLTPRAHALAIWLVAAASTFSAFWILLANGWMQHPVGYERQVVGGVEKAVMVDFWALVTNEYALSQFLHTVIGAFVLSAFFVMGVSAYHLWKRHEERFFTTSFRLAAYLGLLFAVLEVAQGHANGATVAKYQPAKLAAMESLWVTHNGDGARTPQTMLIIPDEKHQRNLVEWGAMPGMLSLLAYHRLDGKVAGLDRFAPADRPPVLLTFLAFRTMVGLGFLFPLIAAAGVLLFLPEPRLARLPLGGVVRRWRAAVLERRRWVLGGFLLSIPLPYLASECGWMLAEVGRQPWIVYNVLRTAPAVSPIALTQVGASLAGLLALYAVLGGANFYLLYKYGRRGPEPALAAGAEG
jgi:cytochrome bd ubiquinol oxidase subunit I